MGYFSQILERVFGRKSNKNKVKKLQWRAPQVEPLEERTLLAVAPCYAGESELVADLQLSSEDSPINLSSTEDNAVAATTSVKYLDQNGKTQEATATIVTQSMTGDWKAGWYVVNSSISMTDASITCKGSVHLILADNGSLTVTGKKSNAGINVTAGNSLTIYGQENNTGVLNATGGKYGAGIGGGEYKTSGTITINGGTITAQGGYGASGIGGGEQGDGQNITIHGGKVTAKGGEKGSGIGGGGSVNLFRKGRDGRNIKITGGTILAQGGSYGAGIGGGGNLASSSPRGGSGIGITITGGNVEARGGEYGAGIGGANDHGHGKNITISGGTVNAYGGDKGAGIGGGCYYGDGTNISIKGGTVNAWAGNKASAIGGGSDGKGSNITVKRTLTVKAGDTAESATVISNSGGDLSGALNGKRYTGTQLTASKVNVSYIDKDGKTQSVLATEINKNYSGEWQAGWYVVNSAVSMKNASITCKGDVHLILADSGSLTVTGANKKGGITVSAGNSLTIYGQQKNTGVLNVTGGEYGAGIGGGREQANGTITINGGTITATGGKGGAGIGGGEKGEGQNITINGGTVTAKGGEKGAGIGAGGAFAAVKGKDARNITINGGKVVAEGGEYAAGIGGGGNQVASLPEGGSGIGITITGGNVEARGGYCGAGIGGANDYGHGENITISGGTVNARGGDKGAGIGGGCSGSGKTISITGGTVNAWAGKEASAIGGGSGGKGSSVTVSKTLTVKVGNTAESASVISNSGDDLSAALNGKRYTGILPAPPQVEATYIDKDGKENKVLATALNDAFSGEWQEGWYLVNSVITMKNASVTCKGNVHLILGDGASLTVNGAEKKAGINVSGSGNSLTVYGQEKNTGILNATGGMYGAGIGGNECEAGENITIYGGQIFAYGTKGGAGIGGGEQGVGRKITIGGGDITATGGEKGAGIGGGGTFHFLRKGNNGEEITITGGKVRADGGEYAAGIGGGGNLYNSPKAGGSAVNITITGGEVEANGGDCGAGIGGANDCGHADKITISGGKVTANGGRRGAGIGGGWKGNATGITINGGEIDAYGGLWSAGIGGGDEGNAEKITIQAGKVDAQGGWYATGIGGGAKGTGKEISITGGSVEASTDSGGTAIGGSNFDPKYMGANITVNVNMKIEAGKDSDKTVVIPNTGNDLTNILVGKGYVNVTPSVLTVTSEAASGAGSLRAVLDAAEDGNTIVFDSKVKEIKLENDSDTIVISKAVTIDGGKNGVTINGQGKVQLVSISDRDSESTVSLMNLSLINGYNEDGSGGALILQDAGNVTLTNCTFRNNRALSGGAISNENTNLTVVNGQFVGNNATGEESSEEEYGGGAIVVLGKDEGAVLILKNCTLTENLSTAQKGNAVYAHITKGEDSYYDVEITNSIIVNNGTQGSELYGTADPFYFTVSDSLGNPERWVNVTNSDDSVVEWNPEEPLFVDPTQGDYHLAEGSQAIDKGENFLFPLSFTTDLDGNTRISNGTVDLGCYEYISGRDSIENLRATVDGNIITVAWEEFEGAADYTLEYKVAEKDEWTVIQGITETSYILKGEYETPYDIRVKTTGSDYSQTVAVTDLSVWNLSDYAPYTDFRVIMTELRAYLLGGDGEKEVLLKDVAFVEGRNLTMQGGKGAALNVTVSLGAMENLGTLTYIGTRDHIFIEGSDQNDYYTIDRESVVIEQNDMNPYKRPTVKRSVVTYDTVALNDGGAKLMLKGAAQVTIDAGDEDDYFQINQLGTAYHLIGGTGDDQIDFSQTSRVVVNMGVAWRQYAIVGQKGSVAFDQVDIERISGSSQNDRITSAENTLWIEGIGGSDTVILNGDVDTSTTVVLNGNHQNVVARGSGFYEVGIENGTGSVVNAASVSEEGSLTLGAYGDRITAYGSRGSDVLNIEGNNAIVYGYAGNDRIIVVGNQALVHGGMGDDSITISGGEINTVYGETGDDLIDLSATDGTNYIYGGEGDDLLIGGAGVDYLYAQSGNDILIGNSETDQFASASKYEILFGKVQHVDTDTFGEEEIDHSYFRVMFAQLNNKDSTEAFLASLGEESLAIELIQFDTPLISGAMWLGSASDAWDWWTPGRFADAFTQFYANSVQDKGGEWLLLRDAFDAMTIDFANSEQDNDDAKGLLRDAFDAKTFRFKNSEQDNDGTYVWIGRASDREARLLWNSEQDNDDTQAITSNHFQLPPLFQ